jgi:hypothetical protein
MRRTGVLSSGIAALLLAAPALGADPLRYTAAETAALRAAAETCTGGTIRMGEGSTNPITAADMRMRLPEPTDPPGFRPDSDTSSHLFRIAHSLLRPALPEAPRASDIGRPWLTCKWDAVVGARLMAWLVGDGYGQLTGPTNSLYWLGQAYRQGVGVPQDAERARSLLLLARLRFLINLTAEDWGRTPNDTLDAVLKTPAGRQMLEKVAALPGNSEAKLLLARQLKTSDPVRARALLESALAMTWLSVNTELGNFRRDGIGGPKDLVGAVEQFAIVAQGGTSNGEEAVPMLAAARAYNGAPGIIPTVDPPPGLADFGGRALLPKPDETFFVSLRGSSPARALLAPDGRILFTELLSPSTGYSQVDRATMWVWNPKRLPKLPPWTVNGRAVFAWVPLPVLAFEPPRKQ